MSTASLSMPAESARLAGTFDPARIVDELTSVRSHSWGRQRVYDDGGIGAETDVDWRCLALRSPGGDPTRTDPGGPSDVDFADTPWLAQLPYVREILASIPAPLHAVRLMALGPDTVGIDHTDPKYSPRWGVVRLHIPIETSPEAILVLDGHHFTWQPGEFWFGDFSRVHRVQNHGSTTRTHLVIDALVVPGLADVFPDAWRAYFEEGDVLVNRQTQPQHRSEIVQAESTFEVPANFHLWEEDVDFDHADPESRVSVSLVAGTDGPDLVLPDGRHRRLVHLGAHEYRFAGWSEERTLQVFPDGPTPGVLLRTRIGRESRQSFVPSTERIGVSS
ncbi:hypothetical protein CH275_21080 [Rhodococcus sp. 06-235-1A]|uniref:aspartyl/asparaginyl beta-hydroxylase domain-containing protein n=1 Tax=Rhodococcus sp. 06-235-1A TaxID=2022508 RepID=UPI000B9AD26B|nr:aspartyl/asparaginyl beta-hydroxylase domain-containing protein [Rhodococcus sp. 06-235-1A]OZD01209.1 hypothetical protein CH275_21080 [Rhodococcus sp. 06-235-1A]